MANYNPHAPEIIGNEWVPIRQSNYQPNDTTEVGYTFYIDHGAIIVSGSNSISDVTPTRSINKVIMNAIYAVGSEDQTGPIQQVIIPVDGVTVTGGSSVATVADFVTPADNFNARLTATAFGEGIGLSFDTSAYSNELTGKRILNIELLYVAFGTAPSDLALTSVGMARAATASPAALQTFTYQNGVDGPATDVTTEINSVQITDVNPFWNPALALQASRERFPWRYNELALLDASAGAGKLQVTLFWNDTVPMVSSVFFKYAALRVTYCEEKRLLYGARDVINQEQVPGVWLHRFLDTFYQNGASTINPGSYTLTSTFRSLTRSAVNQFGNVSDSTTPPTLNAIRQQYELSSIPGVLVNTTEVVNAEFVSEPTDVLPQTMMYTAAAIVTGSHAYGKQISAPVHSGTSPTSQIINGIIGGNPSGSLTQARFYARRYGDSSPLTLHRFPTVPVYGTITATEFDALPEIIDGWKEVTLELVTPLVLTTSNAALSWSSLGSSSSDRWEILGANGPSLVGAGANTGASYQPGVDNSSITLFWKQPNGAAVASDSFSDGVLIFSQTPPIVTGVGLSTCSVAVTGIGQGCAGTPACIPTHIMGNSISWDANTALDDFERVVPPNSWGTTPTGETWTSVLQPGGSIQVSGGMGHSFTDNANETNYMTIPSPHANVRVTADFYTPVIIDTDVLVWELIARFVNTSSYYALQILPRPNSQIDIRLVVAGVGLVSSTFTLTPYTANQPVHAEFEVSGTILRGRMWLGDQEKPREWTVQGSSTAISTAGQVGVRMGTAAGTTNLPIILSIDNFCAVPASIADGSVEIQRNDPITDEWQTIYRKNPCGNLPTFCDMEARAGQVSSYRIRTNNVLDFASPWVSGSVLLPSPAVSGIGDGNSVLMLTSNQDQNASLAYVMNWEGEPIEQFNFPEAGFQQLRTQYGRDFFIAFRPTERGGEQFSRTILVQAAAITPESLADFKSLRDLAWDDLPYVCVRDELGNRWFANIAVPNGRVRNNRTLYLAQMDVTEVTDTAAPVVD